MKGGLAAGFEPLRRYADFTGRSRRSELALFWALTLLAGIIVKWTESAIYISGSSLEPDWFSILFGAVLLCPWAALSVRRLHDSGRSGWWLLLALPVFLINLWDSWLQMNDAFAVTLQSRLPPFVAVPLGFALLALLVLLLWDDEEGANLYGPNPRYGSPEEAL